MHRKGMSNEQIEEVCRLRTLQTDKMEAAEYTMNAMQEFSD